jgi:hypothetical protein
MFQAALTSRCSESSAICGAMQLFNPCHFHFLTPSFFVRPKKPVSSRPASSRGGAPMMQPCASAAKLVGGSAQSFGRCQNHGNARVTTTSDRCRKLTILWSPKSRKLCPYAEIMPVVVGHPPVFRRWLPSATARSAVCVQVRRS